MVGGPYSHGNTNGNLRYVLTNPILLKQKKKKSKNHNGCHLRKVINQKIFAWNARKISWGPIKHDPRSSPIDFNMPVLLVFIQDVVNFGNWT